MLLEEFVREINLFLLERDDGIVYDGKKSKNVLELEKGINLIISSAISEGIIPNKLKSNYTKNICKKDFLTPNDYYFAEESYFWAKEQLESKGIEWRL